MVISKIKNLIYESHHITSHHITSHHIVASFVFLLFGVYCNAQSLSAFITEIPQNQLSLSPPEQTMVNAVQSSSDTKSFKFVTVGDIAALQTNGKICFRLPNSLDTLAAEATVVNYVDANNYQWAGEFSHQRGSIIILRNQDGFYGNLKIGNQKFELRPVSQTKYLLVEKKAGSFEYKCVNSDSNGSTEIPSCPTEGLEYNTCPATVSVLFLLPPDAQTWLNQYPIWIQSLVLLSPIFTTNIAFWNSDIPNKDIRLIIDPQPFNFAYESDDDAEVEAENLADPLMSNANARRTLFKADMVFMLTSHDLILYDNGNPVLNAAGLVRAIGPNKNLAYGIIRIDYLNNENQFTFSHEFAHLAGCRHQWPSSNVYGGDDANVCAHGWIDWVIEDYKYDLMMTIMSYGLPPTSNITQFRTLNYSNPDVYRGFRQTGKSYANNAKNLRNTLCEVDDFFDTKELKVGIVPPINECTRLYQAVVTPPVGETYGQGPYNYTWYWNSNGIFNQNSPSNPLNQGANSPTVDLNGLPCSFFLCLIVAASDGSIVRKVVKVNFAFCAGCGVIGQVDPIQGLVSPGESSNPYHPQLLKALLYPNPVGLDNQITLQLPFESAKTGFLEVFNSRGQFILKQDYEDTEKIAINLEGLSSGTFYVRLQTASKPEMLRFSIFNF